jgi:hypothetical protein
MSATREASQGQLTCEIMLLLAGLVRPLCCMLLHVRCNDCGPTMQLAPREHGRARLATLLSRFTSTLPGSSEVS